MSAAPLPRDEEGRLRALRESELLDSPPEQDWDDLTAIASAVCGTPIALVSLVDKDRQWFKSRVGLDLSETPRDQSFCAHAILGDGVFQVEDTHADERFRDNLLVTGPPDIRFYAGAPIVNDRGHALGTVCVADRKPRALTDQQKGALAALARQASARLRLRDKARLLADARNEIAQSLALVEGTLEATVDGILCVDHEQRVLVCNERFLSMWGFPRVFGQRGTYNPMLGPGIVRLKDPEGYRRLLAEQDLHPEEDRFDVVELADGRVFERYSRPSRSGGAIAGLVNCFRDITDRRQIENLKNEFVSTVSHELRTPLTAIRGALGLLEAGIVGVLPEQAKEFITISRTNCERLIRLVNDILDLEKLEAGRVELSPRPLEAKALIEAALSNVRPLAEPALVSLVSRVAVPSVFADEDRLIQVITKLMSNAVKFSPSDEQVELDVTPGARGGVRVEVRDRGPGIPPSARHKLFRRFQQLDQSDSRPKGGTGLGLAICKAIIEQHHGSIGADERDGGGTTFWLELPSAPTAWSRQRRSVLLVIAQEALAARLEKAVTSAGANAIVVRTLAEAEVVLREGHARAAIVEVKLPDGEAIEWLSRMRESGVPSVPVALVQGEGNTFAPPLIIDSGESTPDARLLRALCQAAVGAARLGSPVRVLIADDDASFRQVVATQLRQLDVEVIEAADGSETVSLARRTRPHLIVLDVGMPGLDGFDVVDLLRQEAGRSTAVLVYTGRSLDERERERLKLGVTRFLTKGVATEAQFLAAVEQLVAAATAE